MSVEHERLKEILAEAAGKESPEAVAAYLEAACQGDSALRQQVEALLSAHARAGDFLEQSVIPPAEEPIGEGPGTRIGRYKLLEKIGEGGFGLVFMAEQTEPVNRKVALKIIKAGMDTREVIARFEAERQALALMDHPNIARVLDAGATETGRPYFVMELVNGIPITDYCDQKQLPTVERLQLFMKVCAAVQHAHQKGIIHRDLKPSNILVTLIDGEAVPKVIDFGVAKALGQKLTEKTLFTAFQHLIGTPAYMSPEQAALSGVDVDTRSDIYSLGVLLYELLTGRTPVDAKTLLAASLDEMRRIIREQDPPRPSTRISTLEDAERTTVAERRQSDPPKLIHEVRGDLDWIAMKCLEKDRARRYPAAFGVVRDIERYLHHEPVSAAAPGTLYLAQKFIRRHRFGVGMAAAVTLALAVGLTAALVGFKQARRERDRAELLAKQEAAQRQRAEADEKKAAAEAAKSQQVAQFLKDMLRSVDPIVALGRDTTMLREILDKTAERVGKDLKDQPEIEAELLSIIGNTYLEVADYPKAEAMHREALRLRKALFGETNRWVADSLHNLSITLDYLKATAESEALCLEALAMRRNLFGSEHPDIARSLTRLTEKVRVPGKAAEAETIQREALTMQRKLLPKQHPDLVPSLMNLGRLLRIQARPTEAEAAFREALEMTRELWGYENPDAASALRSLGFLFRDQDRFAEAEPMLREALAIRMKMLGDEHPFVISARGILAYQLELEGKWDEALALLRESSGRADPGPLNILAWLLATCPEERIRDGQSAVAFAEKAVASSKRQDPMYLDTLAAAYAETGQFTNAINLEKEGMALQPDEEEKKNYTLRLRLYESGLPYRNEYALGRQTQSLLIEGKFAEAEPPARQCLAIRERQVPDDWQTFNARAMLGGSLLGQKNYAEAEPLLLSGYEGMKQREDKIPTPGKPRLRETLQRLVLLYETTGRADQAAAWKQKLAEFEKAESERQSAAPPR